MPESVNDRPTKAHEQVFLLAKKPRYYYDADAVRESNLTNLPIVTKERSRDRHADDGDLADRPADGWGSLGYHPAGRNMRSVWTIASTPLGLSHFATFPIELAARCIKASTSERGVCGRCGAPWLRVVDVERWSTREKRLGLVKGRDIHSRHTIHNTNGQTSGRAVSTRGWQPSCPCGADSSVVPATVFDPFCGAATTLLAARQLGRHGIGVELNREYIDLSLARLRQHTSGRLDGPRITPLDGQGSLFDLVEGA